MKRLSEIVPESLGEFKRWYLSRAEPGHELSVRYVEVDGIVSPHTHLTEETIFFLEGKGTASVERKEVNLTPGTKIVIPPGTMHSTVREGSSPLRYPAIFVGNPDL